MQIEMASVEQLSNDPRNARKHSEQNLAAIKASLITFGAQKPIVVDAAGVVVAGNGMLEAARQLGWSTIPVVRTELVGPEQQAYAIADNRSAELAAWDQPLLDQLIAELEQAEGLDPTSTGFTREEVDAMIRRAIGDVPPGEPPEGFQSYNESIKTDYRCPKCGYEWSGQPK